MKKILIVFCVFLYVLTHGQSPLDSKTKAVFLLNGIKNQESWDYLYDGNKPETKGYRTSLTTYNKSGEVTQVTTYNPSGQVLHLEKYKYDSRGNRTEYTRLSGENAKKPAYQKLSSYNANGRLSEESGYDGVEYFKNIYSYDENGYLSEIRYLANDILKEKRQFIKEGNKTNVLIYNSSGIISSKMILRYDDQENLIEETVYGVNQIELERKLYDYDDNQNLKEEARYHKDQVILSTTYNYNSAGDLIEIYESKPGSDKYLKRGFIYDDKGNLVMIEWRRKNDEAFNRMTYTYNSNGICINADTYYPTTEYRVHTKYTYAYY